MQLKKIYLLSSTTTVGRSLALSSSGTPPAATSAVGTSWGRCSIVASSVSPTSAPTRPRGSTSPASPSPKRNYARLWLIKDVRREVEIMRHLSANPNIVSLHDTYQDDCDVHVVRELFNRIVVGGALHRKGGDRHHMHHRTSHSGLISAPCLL